MNKYALTLPISIGALMLAACNPVPTESGGEGAATDAPAMPTAVTSTGGAPDKAAPAPNAPEAGLSWRYDKERRAAIYGTSDGTPATFWVACKGTPDGRSLYVEMRGREAPAGNAMLSVSGAGLSAVMPMTSAPAGPEGTVLWSGETPLTSNVTKLFETADANVPLTIAVGGKDKRVVPNNVAILQAIKDCKSES